MPFFAVYIRSITGKVSIMRAFLTVLILSFTSFTAAAADNIPMYAGENATYVFREPHAWGAIYKYCIACHGAGAMDGASLTTSLWRNRVDKCILYMRSRGYPRPTKADREALYAFLPLVTPLDRKPPVYLVKPKRGNPAVP